MLCTSWLATQLGSPERSADFSLCCEGRWGSRMRSWVGVEVVLGINCEGWRGGGTGQREKLIWIESLQRPQPYLLYLPVIRFRLSLWMGYELR